MTFSRCFSSFNLDLLLLESTQCFPALSIPLVTFSSESWHIHFRKHSIVRRFLVSDILAITCQWPPEKVTYTWSKKIDYSETLPECEWLELTMGAERGDALCLCFFVPAFSCRVIHCATLVNLFEFWLMIGVMGTHLSEVLGGLIMFHKHLALNR